MFHGWKLVGALAVILFFSAGGGLYVFPVYIASLRGEFGWSMTQISSGAALFAIVMGLSNPVVGTLFARFGARPTMLAAAALFTATLLGYAALVDLWMLYAIMLVAGFAVAGTTILPAQTLVTNWFNVYRGRAMGLTLLGIGAGGFLLPPFNALLIRLLGWRQAWLVSGLIFVVVVIPLIAAFVRTAPAELGLRPDGRKPAQRGGGADAEPTRGLLPGRAVATATFWIVAGSFLFQLIGVSAMNFHFVPFATQEARFGAEEAAFFYGLAVGFSIAGRLIFGWLADRWNPAFLVALAGLLLALGTAAVELLVLRLGLRDGVLWAYAVPFGIGIGGNAVGVPVLVGRCFGELFFSRIMGLLMGGFAIGVIVGVPAAGWIFDRTGSYEWVLVLCAGVLLLSALLASLVRPERHRAEFVAGP